MPMRFTVLDSNIIPAAICEIVKPENRAFTKRKQPHGKFYFFNICIHLFDIHTVTTQGVGMMGVCLWSTDG